MKMVISMNSMIVLDYKSRTPIYEQIIKEVERYVALGVLKPGEQISSIRELALNLGINPNTVKKAYSELEKKNVISTISTKGTFISDNVSKVTEQKVEDLIEEIKVIIKELNKLGLSKEDIVKKI